MLDLAQLIMQHVERVKALPKDEQPEAAAQLFESLARELITPGDVEAERVAAAFCAQVRVTKFGVADVNARFLALKPIIEREFRASVLRTVRLATEALRNDGSTQPGGAA